MIMSLLHVNQQSYIFSCCEYLISFLPYIFVFNGDDKYTINHQNFPCTCHLHFAF